MPPIPTPQQVVEFHRPLFRMLVEAIRLGTIHTQDYSDWKDETVNRREIVTPDRRQILTPYSRCLKRQESFPVSMISQ